MVGQLATARFWVPGWRQAPVFAVLLLAGVVNFSAGQAGNVAQLVAPGWADDLARSPLFDPFGVPASMFVAAVAGLAFKRAFWLWGVALALPAPAMITIPAALLVDRGLIPPDHLTSHGVLAAAVFVNLLVLCTASSALGAGLRMAGEGLAAGRARGPGG